MEGTILITGATGLIGARLVRALRESGAQVRILSRSQRTNDSQQVRWNPAAGELDVRALSGVRGVVNLAGEPIAARRWSPEVKRTLLESRVFGTRLLVSRLRECGEGVDYFISASAIGFYGDRGSEDLDEESSSGAGFLPELSRAWEGEAERAGAFSQRVVLTRIGIVLAQEGGALREMLLPFRLGLGGKLGSGSQYLSWISLRDCIAAMKFLTERPDLAGVFDVVAPQPVTNLEFTKALGEALCRPTIFSLPAFGVSLLFGELGRALLLASTRVRPKRLLESGFVFEDVEIKETLRTILTRRE